MSARGPRTKSTTPSKARAYLSKSEGYLAAAERELDERLNVAATSLAIHAGINAADAVCSDPVGPRGEAPSHPGSQSGNSASGNER